MGEVTLYVRHVNISTKSRHNVFIDVFIIKEGNLPTSYNSRRIIRQAAVGLVPSCRVIKLVIIIVMVVREGFNVD